MPQRLMVCDCGKSAWHRTERRGETPPHALCPACGKPYLRDAVERKAPAATRSWEGRAGQSERFMFQEAGVSDIKRDVPSAKFERVPDQPGSVRMVFESDRHHRRCLKEIGAATDRYQQPQES